MSINQQHTKKDTTPKTTTAPITTTKANLRYMRDKDREIVKGIFRFHEVPGGTLSFSFRAYKEDQVERYDLTDGEIYSIPLGVARHLNKNCWYPEYEYIPGEPHLQGGYGGGKSMRVGRKVRRCSFQSLEFVDIEDLTPEGTGDIVTVETIGTPIL